MRPDHGGRRIEVDGHELWARADGLSGPAVVFVPGGGGIGLDFLPAHQQVAEQTRSVIYDRAGTGLSSDTALPRTAGSVVAELRALLAALEVPAPYVLVGHSLGGAYVQHFAQLHPSEVAGLVLVDPAHEDFDDYVPEHLRLAHSQAERPEPPPVTDELLRLAREQISGYVDGWPEPLRSEVIDQHLRPDRVLTGFHEGTNLVDVLHELRIGGARPAVPITVLSAAGLDAFQLAFITEDDLRAQIAGTEQLAAAIAATGHPGRHRSFRDQSHAGLPMRRPDAIAGAALTLAAGRSAPSRDQAGR